MELVMKTFLFPAIVMQFVLCFVAEVLSVVNESLSDKFYSIFCMPFQADWCAVVIFPLSLLTWIAVGYGVFVYIN